MPLLRAASTKRPPGDNKMRKVLASLRIIPGRLDRISYRCLGGQVTKASSPGPPTNERIMHLHRKTVNRKLQLLLMCLIHSNSKKEKSSLNFKRWLLTLLSIGNFILAPLIIYMGYNASQYDYNDLLVVDKALIALGVWVLLISCLNIFSKS